jgi:hypothetical protein
VTRARAIAALAALLVAPPALGAEGSLLFVVALKAPATLTFTGKSLGDAIAREAVQVGGFQVLGPEAVEQKVGRRAYVRLVECAGDARCLSESGLALGADRIVGGFLAQLESTYQVEVSQVDVRGARRVATFSRQIPIAARRLQFEVARSSVAMLRGETEGTGSLQVSANVPEADVWVDGEPAGRTPVVRRLKPGKHLVQVAKAGYVVSEPRWVEVAEGDEADVQVRLVPLSTGPDASGQ